MLRASTAGNRVARCCLKSVGFNSKLSRRTCTSSLFAVSQRLLLLPCINHNHHSGITITAFDNNPFHNNVIQNQLMVSMFQQPQQQQARSFATKSNSSKSKSNNNNKKKKQPKKLSRNARKRKEKIRNERRNRYRDEQKRKCRMNNLHPAAKMKRVLSAFDYWFSDGNLRNDIFLQNALKDYQGWVRLSTLASFPKLEGWTDHQIIMNALESEAGRKNYRVIFNRELVEKGTINRRVRRLQMNQEASDKMKVNNKRQKWRKRRIRELTRFVEKIRGEFYLPIWKQQMKEDSAEEEQGIQEEMQQLELERQQILKDQWSQFNSIQKITHIAKTSLETVQEFVSDQIYPKKKEEDDDLIPIDDLTVDDIDCWDYYFYNEENYEDQLMEENNEFKEAVLEMENLETELDDERSTRNHNRWFEQEFGREIDREEKREKQLEEQDFKNLGIGMKNLTTEQELPSVIHDDGSDLFMYAIVRHRRVNLNYLAELNIEASYDSDELDPYEYEVGLDYVDRSLDDFPTIEEKKKKKPQKNQLQRYSSERPVDVIRNTKQLAAFVRKLNKSLERSKFKAVGFDVECCSLEMDIRTTLPAMLQLASPEPDGPVGLIWLDKFQNHGKDVMVDEKFKDLTAILNDSEILKVGIGVNGDVKNLADWWGITDKGYSSYFFAGMVDLVNEIPDHLYSESEKKSLQEVCALMLERDLPKMKEKNAKQKKKRRKKGKRVKTSHWRREDLTPEMKKYAADDASASIDIWLKLQECSTGASDDVHEDSATVAASS